MDSHDEGAALETPPPAQDWASTARADVPVVANLVDADGQNVIRMDDGLETGASILEVENRFDAALHLAYAGPDVWLLRVQFRKGVLSAACRSRLKDASEVSSGTGGEPWLMVAVDAQDAQLDPGVAMELWLRPTRARDLQPRETLRLHLPVLAADPAGGPRLTRVQIGHEGIVHKTGPYTGRETIAEGETVRTVQIMPLPPMGRETLRASLLAGAPLVPETTNEILIGLHAADGTAIQSDAGARMEVNFHVGDGPWTLCPQEDGWNVIVKAHFGEGREGRFLPQRSNKTEAVHRWIWEVDAPDGVIGQALYFTIENVTPRSVEHPFIMNRRVGSLPSEVLLRYTGFHNGGPGEARLEVERLVTPPKAEEPSPSESPGDPEKPVWEVPDPPNVEATVRPGETQQIPIDVGYPDAKLYEAHGDHGRAVPLGDGIQYTAPDDFTGVVVVRYLVAYRERGRPEAEGELRITVPAPTTQAPTAPSRSSKAGSLTLPDAMIKVDYRSIASADELARKPRGEAHPTARIGEHRPQYTAVAGAEPTLTAKTLGDKFAELRLSGKLVVGYSSLEGSDRFQFAPIKLPFDVPAAKVRAEVGLDIWIQNGVITGLERYGSGVQEAERGRASRAWLVMSDRYLQIATVEATRRRRADEMRFEDLDGAPNWVSQDFRSGFFLLDLDTAEIMLRS